MPAWQWLLRGASNSKGEWAQHQPQVHVDESPWPVLGLKEWMWVVAGQEFCESLRERVLSPATLVLFHAGDTRSRAELVEQLGEEFDYLSE